MRFDIFQAVAIAYCGNAFLKGEGGDRAPELMGPAHLFRHVQELAFNRNSDLRIQNGCLAVGTKSFFLRMAKEGVDEFLLALDLCRRGGLSKEPSGWGILASSDHGTELWQPSWKGVLVQYDQPSAYRVNYVSAKHSPWAFRRPEPAHVALARLHSLLHETLQICIDLNLAPLFDNVKGAWNGESIGARIGDEMLGSNPSESLRELVLMAIHCVVLVESADWTRALQNNDKDSALEHLGDKLWSAALRAFESFCLAPITCSAQR